MEGLDANFEALQLCLQVGSWVLASENGALGIRLLRCSFFQKQNGKKSRRGLAESSPRSNCSDCQRIEYLLCLMTRGAHG